MITKTLLRSSIATACALAALDFASNAYATGIFAASYSAAIVFNDALGGTTMTLAFDGTNFWSVSGGGTSGVREAKYTSAGAFVASFSPGLDFRSVFTDSTGSVYERSYNSPAIQKQTSPGVFTPYATLSGGTLDVQSSVVLNGAGTEYVAMAAGVVSRWNLGGVSLGSVALSGFGTVIGESTTPQNRGIAAAGSYWLTYNGGGTLSAWDFSGNRAGTTVLTGAGTSFDSDYSLSYANGKAFIVDNSGAPWRGYALGIVPEPASATLLGFGTLLLAARRRRSAQA